jgi:uncharacterized protein YjbI with pentapeptide repeats
MAKLLRLLIAILIVWIVLHTDRFWLLGRLRITRQCPHCNLVGATLREMDLSHANLRNADLRWAVLEKVKLDGADLSGANLRSARLYGVTTQGTEFCGAVMMNAVMGYCASPDRAYLSQRSQTR